tara:strand:- start:615 stop:737 length:123 start_codon:yes stop_codon:yes gene_type:complete
MQVTQVMVEQQVQQVIQAMLVMVVTQVMVEQQEIQATQEL